MGLQRYWLYFLARGSPAVVPPKYSPPPVSIGCLRFAKFCWVGKHINVIMKPTNSPTQGQPNPRKIGLKVAFGPLFFPQQIVLRGLGIVLYRKQTTRNPTQPNSLQSSRRGHPYARKYAQAAEARPPQAVLGRMQLTLFMRLAEHLTALRVWCKQCLPGCLLYTSPSPRD